MLPFVPSLTHAAQSLAVCSLCQDTQNRDGAEAAIDRVPLLSIAREPPKGKRSYPVSRSRSHLRLAPVPCQQSTLLSALLWSYQTHIDCKSIAARKAP